MRPRLPAAAAASDPGREREINEDRVLCDRERGIYAVIDGVGGESGGEVAAEIAAETLAARLSRRTAEPGRLIREAIALANRRILERARDEPRLAGMACVLTVAVVDGGERPATTVGHVGDSRLYLLHKGRIEKLTRDHSPVGAREDAGELSEADAMGHPRRNEIYRDVGSAPHEPDDEGWIDVLAAPFDPEGALLLCSDGLSDLVPSREILEAAETHAGRPEATVRELVARANAKGGKDNVSVVLVEGERYAASLRSRAPARAEKARPPDPGLGAGPPRGGAQARAGAVARWGRALGGRAAFLLYGLLIGGIAAVAFAGPLGRLAGLGGTSAAPAALLRVGPGEAHATIAAALAAARPGDTVEVAPGDYVGPVRLADGVALVAAEPRGAVLRTGADGAPAVVAERLRNARLEGFRIAPGAGTPPGIGVRVLDSTVELEGLEVTGMAAAGVEIAGAGRTVLRWSHVHGNPGAGVTIGRGAAPRLTGNLIAGNGFVRGRPRPGIEVGAGCRPLLAENRIVGNGGGEVSLPRPEGADEILRWNSFGGAPRNMAVRVRPAPLGQSVPGE